MTTHTVVFVAHVCAILTLAAVYTAILFATHDLALLITTLSIGVALQLCAFASALYSASGSIEKEAPRENVVRWAQFLAITGMLLLPIGVGFNLAAIYARAQTIDEMRTLFDVVPMFHSLVWTVVVGLLAFGGLIGCCIFSLQHICRCQ